MEKIDKKVLQEKQAQIAAARENLKKEFIGIDQVIDSILDAVAPWYSFNFLQERPTIVNLWGLTGTGKTSLLLRLMELLGIEEDCFRFDMGEGTLRGGISNLDEYIRLKDEPPVIIFDEFQHFKTKNELHHELPGTYRFIWDILDSGTFLYFNFFRSSSDMYEKIEKLKSALTHGVKIENGYIVSNKKLYCKIAFNYNVSLNPQDNNYSHGRRKWDGEYVHEDEEIFILSFEEYECILEIEMPEFKNVDEIQTAFSKLNGHEAIELLKKIHRFSLQPKMVDCRKAIIFVVGNLDEAYQFSGLVGSSITADVFHQLSKEIGVNDIKNALRKRFRDEQVARLGNRHIIYPAFNEANYRDIIDLELGKVHQNFFKSSNVQLRFAESLKNEIFQKGVDPVQGTRPVFSTIHELVSNHLPYIMTLIYDKNIQNVDTVSMGINGKWMQLSFLHHDQILEELSFELNNFKDKEFSMSDEAVIIAVHETGHALAYMLLTKRAPQQTIMLNSQGKLEGWMMGKNVQFHTLADIKNELRIGIAGMIAEKLVFGEQAVSSGSGNDLVKITELAYGALCTLGFGHFKGYFSGGPFTKNLPIEDSIHQKVKEMLQEAEWECQQLLEKNIAILQKICKVLMEKKKLMAEDMVEIMAGFNIEIQKTNFIERSKNGNYLACYRAFEKEKLSSHPQIEEKLLQAPSSHNFYSGTVKR